MATQATRSKRIKAGGKAQDQGTLTIDEMARGAVAFAKDSNFTHPSRSPDILHRLETSAVVYLSVASSKSTGSDDLIKAAKISYMYARAASGEGASEVERRKNITAGILRSMFLVNLFNRLGVEDRYMAQGKSGSRMHVQLLGEVALAPFSGKIGMSPQSNLLIKSIMRSDMRYPGAKTYMDLVPQIADTLLSAGETGIGTLIRATVRRIDDEIGATAGDSRKPVQLTLLRAHLDR